MRNGLSDLPWTSSIAGIIVATALSACGRSSSAVYHPGGHAFIDACRDLMFERNRRHGRLLGSDALT